MPNVCTIREAVTRAKADGLPVTEYSLRRWIRTGAVPVRMIGNKALLFYPNLLQFIQCEDGADNAPATEEKKNGIRRIEVG